MKRKIFREANSEVEKYGHMLLATKSAQDQYNTSVASGNTVLEGQIADEKRLLTALGATAEELHAADEKAEQRRIRKKYDDVAEAYGEMRAAQEDRTALVGLRNKRSAEGDFDSVASLTKKIEEFDKSIEYFRGRIVSGNRDAGDSATVLAGQQREDKEEYIANYKPGDNAASLKELMAITGKSHAQQAEVLAQLVDHHRDYLTTIAQLKAQLAALAQHGAH